MIGLIVDKNTNWWTKFEKAFISRDVVYRLVEIERSDWLHQLEGVDHVVWRPNLSEPFFSQAREKLTIIEFFLNKKVFPDFNTFWHYNNKNAQVYLSDLFQVPFPKNFVSYDYNETIRFLDSCEYPVVSKSKGGSASRNVRKYDNFEQAKRDIDRVFNEGLWYKVRDKILSYLKLSSNRYSSQFGYVNIQKFIKGNSRDFRVTTIGGKYAYGYFRNNRKGDFRASGSGLNDYDPKDHDLQIIKYFVQLSARMGFQSMCYDVLVDEDGKFYCVEYSYIYVDQYLYNCPGYYELENDELKFVNGSVWPQELIVESLLRKWDLTNE